MQITAKGTLSPDLADEKGIEYEFGQKVIDLYDGCTGKLIHALTRAEADQFCAAYQKFKDLEKQAKEIEEDPAQLIYSG